MASIKILISADLKELYKKIVANTGCKASRLLLEASEKGIDVKNLDKDFACYIKISSEDKTQISYNRLSEVAKKLGLDVEKILSGEIELPSTEETYTTIGRTKIRPGRIFTKIFKTEYTGGILSNPDIEAFSNRYNAELNNQLTFKLVKGEEIRKSYFKPNYTTRWGGGTLHGSCMNGDRQQEFLDIYTKNDNISLLVAYDIDNKVAGRALIWSNVSIKDRNSSAAFTDGVTYMDRIYYTQDWMQDKFKDYARKNGWYHRRKQAFDEETIMVDPKGNAKDVTMKVTLENIQHKFYPYLDTFYVPCYGAKFLTNNRDIGEYNSADVHLRQTGGITAKIYNFIDRQYVDKNRCVWMKNKTTYYPSDNSVFSSKSDDYFIKSECLFSKLDNEYITPDEETDVCAVTFIRYKKAKMIASDYHNGLIHKKEAVESKDKGVIHKNDAVFSKTFKCWLSQKGALKIESIDDFVPSDIMSKVPEKQFIDFLTLMNSYLPKEEEKKESIEVEQYVFEF